MFYQTFNYKDKDKKKVEETAKIIIQIFKVNNKQKEVKLQN